MANNEVVDSTLTKSLNQVGDKTKYMSGARIHPSFKRGIDCFIGPLANIGDGVVIEDNVYINGSVSHSYLSHHTEVRGGAEVHYCVSEPGVMFEPHSKTVNVYAEVNVKIGAYAGIKSKYYLLWRKFTGTL